MATLPTLADVYLAGEDACDSYCAICGDDFEKSQPVVDVPAGFGPSNMLVLVHLSCAVKEEEIEMTGTYAPRQAW